MTKRITVLAAGIGALALSLAFAPIASAQQSPKTGRTAVSKECSAKADEQKLHGKERRKFRSKCIKDARKKPA
jgi:psiF repeat